MTTVTGSGGDMRFGSFLPNFLAGIVLFLVISTPVFATHLVGGSITYRELGRSSVTGQYAYIVRVEMFRDCTPQKGGNAAIPFSDPIQIGIYERKIDTPLVDTKSIHKMTEFSVNP